MSNSLTTAGNHTPAIQITTFDQLMRFAGIAAKSGMVPQAYINKPEAVLIAVQMGSELGLAPLQSLQNIAVINGRPSVWGDALLGLVKAAPVCDDVIEHIEGDGDHMVAVCIAKRKGKSPVERRFSVADAQAASLWNKQGPWKQYPKRMLQMRARGFALRDAFPDVLRGLITAEEAQDTPQETVDIAPQHNRIAEQKTPTPVENKNNAIDYRSFVSKRLQGCIDANNVENEWNLWRGEVQKCADQGHPIPEDVQSDVQDMIAAKRAEFAQEHAAAPVDEVPA